MDKFGFEHKIIRPLPNKIVTYEGKIRESDFVGLLDNGDILNLEAHSTAITQEDKKKFFDYATYHSIKNQKDDIKTHTLVLSSHYKKNGSIEYKWHGSSGFTIPYKSFNTFDAEKTINKIRLRNMNNEELDDDEIADLRILTFMKSESSHKDLLIESVKLTNEANMDERERAYTKTLQSFLARKFIQDDAEYEEVMKMIEMGSEEFSFGPLHRYFRIKEKRMEDEFNEKLDHVIEEKDKEIRTEKEKNKKNMQKMEKN